MEARLEIQERESGDSIRIWVLIGVIALAALLRLVPHPPNFSPITAMALFAGWSLRRSLPAILVPLAAMLLSDLALGFHAAMPAVYFAIAMVSVLGLNLKSRVSFAAMGGATVLGSVIFFFITNLAVFLQSDLYPQNVQGLLTCFTAAIPFFENSILGDLFYSGLLFWGWSYAENRVPRLRAS